MKRIFILGLATALLAVASTRADEPAPSQIESLIGTYTITSGERNGMMLPAVEIRDVTVQIATNAISTFDRDKKQVYVATYKLNKDKKPWAMTMTAMLAPGESRGTVAHGLIKQDGDTVYLIYALPMGEPPTTFKTKAHQQMFTLKRTAR